MENLQGLRFGRLIVLDYAGKSSSGRVQWACRCDCGNTLTVRAHSLKCGETKSCGCLHREKAASAHTTHGGSKSRLNRIFRGMHQRCTNPKSRVYQWYGGKGVTVCEEWAPGNFGNFQAWALSNGYEEHLTLDRIDPNGTYCPENCRWITIQDQQRNRNPRRRKTELTEETRQ